MKQNNVFLKILTIAIFFLLIVTSASNAVNIFEDKINESSRSLWEDSFNDASKIDTNPSYARKMNICWNWFAISI